MVSRVAVPSSVSMTADHVLFYSRCNPKLYLDFDPNIDVAFSERVIEDMRKAGIKTEPSPNFVIIHDTFLVCEYDSRFV